MKPLWIEFTVQVRDNKYGFDSKHTGNATTQMEIPEEMFKDVNFGNVLEFLGKVAFLDFFNRRADALEEERNNPDEE